MEKDKQHDSESESATTIPVDGGPPLETGADRDLEPAHPENEKKLHVEDDVTLVEFKESDPLNPLNMSPARKWLITIIVSNASLCVTCNSSIYTSTYTGIQDSLHISHIVAIIGLTLFIAGLGTGPLFLAPLSEFFGRRPIYLISYTLFCLLNIPLALSPTVWLFHPVRFIHGISGSAFLSVAGGTVSDMFAKKDLGGPMAVYTASPFLGPVVGPILGGFIVAGAGWRWVFWVSLIWSFVVLVAIALGVPETYAPKLLVKVAAREREATGNPILRAPMEVSQKSILKTIGVSVLRPFQLLMYEPIILALNVYTAFLLGILYLFFQAFPLVFHVSHGFPSSCTGLAFLGIGIGMVAATLSQPYWNGLYARRAQELAAKGEAMVPEERLRGAMAGGVLVPVGMLWFAFTSYKSIHWIVPIIAGIPFGAGVLLVYIPVFSFLVDSYRVYAASALASNSFVRSSFAAGFPLFSSAMYERLGNVWASAVLGFICLAMMPIPFFFFYKGQTLRKWSRYAYS
ncbi:hypothetical protein YB2330_005245 [Saitoella coloradoensis]